MAARNADRKKAWTPTRVRERIRVGLLMRRLTDHVLGKVEMTTSQVQAATFLVSQSIGSAPKSVEHTGQINVVNYDAAVLGLLNGSAVEAGDAASAPTTIQ